MGSQQGKAIDNPPNISHPTKYTGKEPIRLKEINQAAYHCFFKQEGKEGLR